MKATVVTSCSAEGWQHYGQRFVESFLQFWPGFVDLILCSEDDITRAAGQYAAPNFRMLNLRDVADGFIRRHAQNPVARGRKRIPGQHWKPGAIASGYNFRFDAARFGLKVFAIQMAVSSVGRGRLFWLDADVVTFAHVPPTLLEETLPTSFALSCLDRGPDYHSECGFVGYNLDDPQTVPFLSAFLSLYETDAVMKLPEWHDSWVFDHVRRAMRVPTHCIPHRSRSHPFANSALSAYMDHVKGCRKAQGRTPKTERVIRDGNPYWA
jgi:hypothetical protein